MPRFDTTKRYVNKYGKVFGKGVWIDDDGTIIYPGQGKNIIRKNQRTITQYNTDGTQTVYPWKQWAMKNQREHEMRVLQKDRRYSIPYIPNKKITISIDKNSPTRNTAGATFSENVLDSIAVNARRAGLPFGTALGLSAQESTIGQQGRGKGVSMLPWLRVLNASSGELTDRAKSISYKGKYSPTLLISNWKEIGESPFYDYYYDPKGYLLDKNHQKDDKFYDEDINSARVKANKYRLKDQSPLEHGFREYKEHPEKWNPGDINYPNKVKAMQNELVNYSPEIRNYMQKNHIKAEGGSMEKLKGWNELSMKEKSDVIGAGVRNGLTTISDIKGKWNEFAEGWQIDEKEFPEDRYGQRLNGVEIKARYPHENRVIDAMNRSNVEFIQRLRNNDRRSIRNADGSRSTHMLGSVDNIVFPAIQVENGRLKDNRGLPWRQQLEKAIDNKDYIQFDTNGDARYFGEHYKKYFPEFFKDGEFAEGGWLMEDGGYSPGNGIRNDIAKWEGSSMKANRSFEAEAEDFNRVIPKSVRDRLTPDQLNALYSYGYNVGMGNLKKRVLPTLEEYVNGRASAEDVGRSMWATKDVLYRGLQRRREWERNMFAGRPYSSRSNGIAYNPSISNNAAVEVATMTPFQFTGPRPQAWQQNEAVKDEPQWFDVVLENARKNPVVIEEPKVMTTPEPQEERYTPSRADILMALTGMNSDNSQDEWSNIFGQYENDEPSQGLSIFGNGQRLFAGGGSTDNPENYESQVNAYMNNDMTGLPFVDENGVPMKEVMLTGPMVVYDRKLGRNLTDEEYLARHPKASTTFDRLDLPQYRAVAPAEGWAMKRSADRDWLENATNGVPKERGLEIVSPEFDMVMLPRVVANGAIGATWNGSKELLKNTAEGFESYVARHPKLQYGLAGLDAAMGAEGIDRARNGELNAQTALDLATLAAPAYGVTKNGMKMMSNILDNPDSRLNMLFANHNIELGDWSIGVPKKEGRYIRIVGGQNNKYGDAISDANKTGVIRSAATQPERTRRFLLSKQFEYPMFTRGETWAINPDKYLHNARLIRSKADTGSTIWQESNKDFRHKGHNGIFRPMYDGDLQSFPTRYAEWWDRPNIGSMKNRWLWKRHEFEQPFKSELDWRPESWFGTRIKGNYDADDVAALKSHLPEYTNIEKTAKANGTWLKMPDGSTWQGDPRSWVQIRSQEGQKMMPTILYHGEKVVRPAEVLGNRRLWASTNANIPISYGDYHYQLSIPKQAELSVFNANGNRWAEIKDMNGNIVNTDYIVNKAGADNNVTVIKNVVDPGDLTVNKILSDDLPVAYPKESFEDYTKRVFLGDDYVLGRDVPRKSLLGNNGNFDLSLPDIYKTLIPVSLVLSKQQLNTKKNERR